MSVPDRAVDKVKGWWGSTPHYVLATSIGFIAGVVSAGLHR